MWFTVCIAHERSRQSPGKHAGSAGTGGVLSLNGAGAQHSEPGLAFQVTFASSPEWKMQQEREWLQRQREAEQKADVRAAKTIEALCAARSACMTWEERKKMKVLSLGGACADAGVSFADLLAPHRHLMIGASTSAQLPAALPAPQHGQLPRGVRLAAGTSTSVQVGGITVEEMPVTDDEATPMEATHGVTSRYLFVDARR